MSEELPAYTEQFLWEAECIRLALVDLLGKLDALAKLPYGSEEHREQLARVQGIKSDFETREKVWGERHSYHWGEAL